MENPGIEEVRSIVKTYGLHPLVGEELLGPSKSSKAAVYKGYVYLVLKFPIRVREGAYHAAMEKEIDFIIGKDFIITTRYEVIQPLHAFGKAFEANTILDKDTRADHAGHVFYYMMRRMYAHMLGDVEAVKGDLTAIEGKVFTGKEKDAVEVLSSLSRELLDFRQACRSHLEVLESLAKSPAAIADKEFAPYITDIKDSFVVVRDAITNTHELARELRETNDSLLNTKQNETMKILTVVAFITYPLMLLVQILEVNSPHNPIIQSPYNFELILVITVAATVFMLWYFKHRKWL